jgi:cell division septation protein DedD
MNKVVAILGVIVVITLGALFFFAGFYMGNTSTFGSSSKTEANAEGSKDKKITLQDINAQIAAQSNNISDKVMKIISNGADNISTSVSKVVTKINHQNISQMSADSLLKEIIASHSDHDDCSVEKTEKNIQSPQPLNKDSLRGKKVVFIGYFKDNVALQIQQLLIGKGYKVHVEQSKTSIGESFIFCGPFKKKENADKLVEWLREHDFSEAKVVNLIQASVENTLADSLDDDSDVPENEEEEIPEVDKDELKTLAENA